MTDFDSTARSSDLDVYPEELRAGIVALKLITLERLTIVVAKSKEGFLAVGTNAPWPDASHVRDIGIAAARHHATERLAILRDKNGQRYARRVPA